MSMVSIPNGSVGGAWMVGLTGSGARSSRSARRLGSLLVASEARTSTLAYGTEALPMALGRTGMEIGLAPLLEGFAVRDATCSSSTLMASPGGGGTSAILTPRPTSRTPSTLLLKPATRAYRSLALRTISRPSEASEGRDNSRTRSATSRVVSCMALYAWGNSLAARLEDATHTACCLAEPSGIQLYNASTRRCSARAMSNNSAGGASAIFSATGCASAWPSKSQRRTL
mmetsp:Transcript_12624/g.35500  ORF Transcript_12624/g.35500 Transcript_12624/m.35500 type:complete len:229 (-) Transcript_12624:797-1483(-)